MFSQLASLFAFYRTLLTDLLLSVWSQ